MHNSNIGDANVERLLERAYRPESVDTVFAREIEERMCAEAAQISRAAGASEYLSPGQPYASARERVIRRRLGWAMGLAASLAAGFLIYYAHSRQTREQQFVNNRLGVEARPAFYGDGTSFGGLTARPRPETPPAKPLEVGT